MMAYFVTWQEPGGQPFDAKRMDQMSREQLIHARAGLAERWEQTCHLTQQDALEQADILLLAHAMGLIG